MRYMLILLAATLVAADPFSVHVSGNPQGQPVLLIPGLSSSAIVWDDTVKHLAPKYQTHAFTLAGFAGQPRLNDGPYLEAVKDAIVTYIQTNKLKQPIIIGHSLGGHMALWIASQNPTNTGPLVIVDSLPHLGAMMFPNPATLAKQADAMRTMIAGQTAEQYGSFIKSSGMLKSIVGDRDLPVVTDWSLKSDPIAVGNAMYDLYTTDLREAVSNIKSKTLILASWIAYKQYATKEQTMGNYEIQYAKLATKTIKPSDTAKHFIMLDDPDWFLLQLDTFLQ